MQPVKEVISDKTAKLPKDLQAVALVLQETAGLPKLAKSDKAAAEACGCDNKTVRNVLGETADLPKLPKPAQAAAEHATGGKYAQTLDSVLYLVVY